MTIYNLLEEQEYLRIQLLTKSLKSTQQLQLYDLLQL
nr:MAG TPA: hypothetical protein [Caudoviricetes sp.]